MEARVYFEQLVAQLQEELPEVLPGNMMRSPALTTQGNVFCFLSKKNTMVFKLGKIERHTIRFEHHPQLIAEFNPFKTKGPLRGWWEVPFVEKDLWKPLAKQAFNHLNQTL
ncbi:hypothetical protein BKI52_36220 [marine bacterium AO1-C]|nr:hypothetical protein BKI52_36220 [marine bacterium AO1-C]